MAVRRRDRFLPPLTDSSRAADAAVVASLAFALPAGPAGEALGVGGSDSPSADAAGVGAGTPLPLPGSMQPRLLPAVEIAGRGGGGS